MNRAIAGERIGHRPAGDRKRKARVAPWQRGRSVAGVARPQCVEQQEVPAGRRAEPADQFRARGEPLGIRLQKANAEIHICNRIGVARHRRHAEVDRQHGDAVRGEVLGY